jgi:hypothetical protein
MAGGGQSFYLRLGPGAKCHSRLPCHPVSHPTKIYILGAGCSICGGYPAADGVATALKDFARDHLKSATGADENLKRCVERTCALLNEHPVETIDALAKKLFLLEQLQFRDALTLIEEAKIAMNACFLSLEDEGARRAYPNYSNFFNELFRHGTSDLLEKRVEATPCRVLTYNYDRLFERTFLKWAEDKVSDKNAWEMIAFLNSGLNDNMEIKITPSRFSFLKLHGGIGQTHREKGGGLLYPHCWPKYGEQIPPEFIDENYYERPKHKGDRRTIIFPHEKRDAGTFFQKYDSVIWGKANEFCAHATEIHIIGYSIQDIDYFSFKSLIREAKHCTRIILRNRPEAKDSLVRKLDGIKEEFSAKWAIVFLAEDLFLPR